MVLPLFPMRLNILTIRRRWRIAWESAALLDSGGSVIGLAAVNCELTGSKKLEDSSGDSCGFEGVGRSIGRIAGSLGDLLTALTGYCTILQNRPPTDQIDGVLREVNAVAEQ